jgi:glycosyltransferase involved in cell wall biosynthesis
LVGADAGAREFAAAIGTLLDDHALRAEVVTRLRRVVERDFSVQRSGRELAELVCGVAGHG